MFFMFSGATAIATFGSGKMRRLVQRKALRLAATMGWELYLKSQMGRTRSRQWLLSMKFT